MKEILKKLFLPEEKSDRQEPDGLTQAQREAMIDLLVLATYSDDFVDVNEDRVLERVTERFNWKSDVSIDEYISTSAIKSKEVGASEVSKDIFISDIGLRLNNKKDKYQALRLCNTLLYSDADLQKTEVKFLKSVSKAFGLK